MPQPNLGEVEATTRERVLHRSRRRLRRLLADQWMDVPGASPVSPRKASEILSDGTVHGHRLTPAQRRLFQGVKHGWRPTRL